MNNSQTWKTNVHPLLHVHACTNLNCCSCDSRGDHVSLFSHFYTLGLFGVTITSTAVTNNNQFLSLWGWGQAQTSSNGWGLCLHVHFSWLIDVRMPVFFSVNLYVDITEQEQKNHKKCVSFFLQSHSNKIVHTLFFAISQSSSVSIRWQLFCKRRERLAFTSGSTITWGCDILDKLCLNVFA